MGFIFWQEQATYYVSISYWPWIYITRCLIDYAMFCFVPCFIVVISLGLVELFVIVTNSLQGCNDWLIASDATLKDIGRIDLYQTTTQSVCMFLGMYCIWNSVFFNCFIYLT